MIYTLNRTVNELLRFGFGVAILSFESGPTEADAEVAIAFAAALIGANFDGAVFAVPSLVTNAAATVTYAVAVTVVLAVMHFASFAGEMLVAFASAAAGVTHAVSRAVEFAFSFGAVVACEAHFTLANAVGQTHAVVTAVIEAILLVTFLA